MSDAYDQDRYNESNQAGQGDGGQQGGAADANGNPSGTGYSSNNGPNGSGYNSSNGQNGASGYNYYADRYRNEGRQSGGAWQNTGSWQDAGSWQSGPSGQNGQGGYSGQEWHNEARDGYSSGSGQKPPKKHKKGVRIAVAVGLVALFVVFCLGVSWVAARAVNSRLQANEGQQSEQIQPDGQNGQGQQDGAAAGADNGGANGNGSVSGAGDGGQAASGAGSSVQGAGTVTPESGGSVVVTDVTRVVEMAMPSCVSITNQYTEEFQDFWGQTWAQNEESSGSGVIIGQNDTELLIATNNHVVEDNETLYVQFIDGETVQAQTKGTDATVDLAVVAVKLDDLSASTKDAIRIATMGDSDTLKIGEPAIAIGNSLGYGQSVTTGVISALDRDPERSETGASTALIQTDAAINPGNSGGALLNIYGEVIGINSSKIESTMVEGMGYAIPISTARPIIEQLMQEETKERVAEEDRGYLGITCLDVTDDMIQIYDVPVGVCVAKAYDGLGAQAAGLQRGDIIVAFDGTAVESQQALTRMMTYYRAGDVVPVTIMRSVSGEYQEMTIDVTLCSLDDLNQASEESQAQEQQIQRRP